MYLPANGLNYAALLAQDDRRALVNALGTVSGTEMDRLLEMMGLDLGAPQVRDGVTPLSTRVYFVPTIATGVPPHDFVDYTRLDLGTYMACCQRHVPASVGATASAVAAWLGQAHGLYFLPGDLVVTVDDADPNDPLLTQWHVDVVAGNYVWVGSVTLLAAPDNHLALYASAGTAQGLVLSDVLPVT